MEYFHFGTDFFVWSVRKGLLSLLVLATAILVQEGIADTIFTNSARTKDFNGQGLLPRITYQESTRMYRGNRKATNPMDVEMRVFSAKSAIVFGLWRETTVSLNIPYVYKERQITQEKEKKKLKASGLGDVMLMVKHRFFKSQELTVSTEMAIIGGLKLPTGADEKGEGDLPLPRPLQPGTGSVDGIFGLALTHFWGGGRWLTNGDVMYRANSEADGFRFGNAFNFDIGGHFRLYPKKYQRYDQLTVNLVAEANGVHTEKHKEKGLALDDTGGLKIFLSPGVQAIVSDTLLLEAGANIPVYRNLNGPQLGENLKATTGIRWLF